MRKKLLTGFNDIQTTHPLLAMEWHYEKNADLKPEHFTADSSKVVWWMCSSGHSWQDKISNRKNGLGCPYDAGKLFGGMRNA